MNRINTDIEGALAALKLNVEDAEALRTYLESERGAQAGLLMVFDASQVDWEHGLQVGDVLDLDVVIPPQNR
jgi:hypothetical protein